MHCSSALFIALLAATLDYAISLNPFTAYVAPYSCDCFVHHLCVVSAGIGQGAGGKGTNFYICDKATTNQKEVEKAFLDFTEVRKDIAILLITQGVAQHIRHLVDAHTAAVSLPSILLIFPLAFTPLVTTLILRVKQVPAILEIPSKDAPYDPNQDSVMMRIQKKMNVGK